ncbi:hypothetical protein PAMA_008748 [Pampus argenteus]
MRLSYHEPKGPVKFYLQVSMAASCTASITDVSPLAYFSPCIQKVGCTAKASFAYNGSIWAPNDEWVEGGGRERKRERERESLPNVSSVTETDCVSPTEVINSSVMASVCFIPTSTSLKKESVGHTEPERERERERETQLANSANRPTSDFAAHISFKFFGQVLASTHSCIALSKLTQVTSSCGSTVVKWSTQAGEAHACQTYSSLHTDNGDSIASAKRIWILAGEGLDEERDGGARASAHMRIRYEPRLKTRSYAARCSKQTGRVRLEQRPVYWRTHPGTAGPGGCWQALTATLSPGITST